MAMSVRNPPTESDSGINQQSESHRDYSLNPDRTLRKKLQAAKRQHVEYMVKDGGIVANMDAMSFELFRYSCEQLYHFPVNQIQKVKKDCAKDTKGNIVQTTYTVSLKGASTYTLNLYLTKCSLLVNGKATQHFINEDLSTIHQIMSQVTVQGMRVDTKKLNELLATQLQKILEHGNVSTINSSPKTRKQNTVNQQLNSSIECLKCKRNCKKRAVQCDSCDRWLHYNCERLSEEEVKVIESSKDYSYRCKICKNFSSVQHRLMLPALPRSPENTVPKTLTESILSDETGTECVLCCEPLNDDEVSCEKCGSICHLYCMSPLNLDSCQACVATDDILMQNSQEQTLKNTLTKSPTDRQNSVESENDPPLQFTQSDETEKLSKNLSQRESDLSAKQRELRQLEAKVRKKEGELKLKEIKIKEYEKNSGKMESKIEMLEFRNKELEHIILNLQERIDLLDVGRVHQSKKDATPNKNSGNSQPNLFNSKSRYDNLIQGIHDRVSAYVLLKVEKQIETLIDLESDIDRASTLNSASHDINSIVNRDIYVPCQNISDASIQTENIEPQLPRVQTENVESQLPSTQTQNHQGMIYCAKAPYSPQNCNPMYQQEVVNNSLTINNPQCVTGQSLYYGSKQRTAFIGKSTKRFLRHSNLITLVN